MSQKCENCGTVYPDEMRKQWGRIPQTNGEGPSPKCLALVDSDLTVVHPVTKELQRAQFRCGGQLYGTAEAPTGIGAEIAEKLPKPEAPTTPIL